MSRVVIPVVNVQANAVVDSEDDPYDLVSLGVNIDAGNDHTLLNPTGKVALIAILDSESHAVGTLSIPTNPTAGDTMTIGIGAGSKVYTFRATADYDADGEIEILGTAALTRGSIIAAINGTDAENTAHTQVTAVAASGNDITITAIDAGTLGNVIATTETYTAVGNVFGAATLATGGATPSAQITVVGVDDPYGRGASPAGDLVVTLDAPGVYLLGRFTPAMFNQSGASVRKVFVNGASVTGTNAVHLVAVAL